ncbi:MAG: hypothetical protein QXD72_01640 [Candidatus Aenigmatarchaeota archaeon]
MNSITYGTNGAISNATNKFLAYVSGDAHKLLPQGPGGLKNKKPKNCTVVQANENTIEPKTLAIYFSNPANLRLKIFSKKVVPTTAPTAPGMRNIIPKVSKLIGMIWESL